MPLMQSLGMPMSLIGLTLGIFLLIAPFDIFCFGLGFFFNK